MQFVYSWEHGKTAGRVASRGKQWNGGIRIKQLRQCQWPLLLLTYFSLKPFQDKNGFCPFTPNTSFTPPIYPNPSSSTCAVLQKAISSRCPIPKKGYRKIKPTSWNDSYCLPGFRHSATPPLRQYLPFASCERLRSMVRIANKAKQKRQNHKRSPGFAQQGKSCFFEFSDGGWEGWMVKVNRKMVKS